MEQKQQAKDEEQARQNQEKLDKPEKEAAKAYQEWIEKTGLDQQDPAYSSFRAKRIIKDLIDGKEPEDFNEDDKDFAKSLNEVKNTLMDIGVPKEELESRMSDTISRIQSGDIRPES